MFALRPLLRTHNVHEDAHRSYRYETVAALTISIAIGLMEGGFVGVLADKSFHVHPAVLALVTAAPMFGNLLSFLWTRLAHGRPRVPVLIAMHLLFLACVVCVALLPTTPLGGWLFAAAVVAARVLISGIMTVRTTIWLLNYPRVIRGRLIGRLALIASLLVMVTTTGGSMLLDAAPGSFRLVYPLGAVVALVGVLAYARIRLVDEAHHLALERGDLHADHGDAGEPGATPGAEPTGLLDTLRSDGRFRAYMLWQFLLGTGNMMIQAPLIHLVSRRLGASYFVSVGIMTIIPMLLATVTMTPWSAYLDRVHVARFRQHQCVLWALAHGITWGGAAVASLPLLAVGRIVFGIARGGGMVAWQIGHHDFASRRADATYMGIHVTLTGVRGAIAPFFGMLLYLGWSPLAPPAVPGGIPGFPGIGVHVFAIAAVFSLAAQRGFSRLHAEIATQAAVEA